MSAQLRLVVGLYSGSGRISCAKSLTSYIRTCLLKPRALESTYAHDCSNLGPLSHRHRKIDETSAFSKGARALSSHPNGQSPHFRL